MNVKELIKELEKIEDKEIPVYLDVLDPDIWGIIKDISVVKNSYSKDVVILNQDV